MKLMCLVERKDPTSFRRGVIRRVALVGAVALGLALVGGAPASADECCTDCPEHYNAHGQLLPGEAGRGQYVSMTATTDQGVPMEPGVGTGEGEQSVRDWQ